jgi:hypothetical protein
MNHGFIGKGQTVVAKDEKDFETVGVKNDVATLICNENDTFLQIIEIVIWNVSDRKCLPQLEFAYFKTKFNLVKIRKKSERSRYPN